MQRFCDQMNCPMKGTAPPAICPRCDPPSYASNNSTPPPFQLVLTTETIINGIRFDAGVYEMRRVSDAPTKPMF